MCQANIFYFLGKLQSEKEKENIKNTTRKKKKKPDRS